MSICYGNQNKGVNNESKQELFFDFSVFSQPAAVSVFPAPL